MVMDLDFLSSEESTDRSELTTGSREGELCLRFAVPSGNEFALPAAGVREVISVYLDRITPIPNASPFLMGTYNWRGQVIWVGDLGQFLGDAMTIDPNQNEVTVLIVEEQETMMGLAVAAVANTEWLDVDLLQADPTAPEPMRPYVTGAYTNLDRSQLRLLDRVAILRSPQWSI
jgi:purine-binding chemotaxis protein CheW